MPGAPDVQTDLSGKVALVTGAGRGLGRAISLALAGAGAMVLAVARTEDDLVSLARESGGRVTPMVDDVLSSAFYDRVQALPRLDILMNNAGGNKPMAIVDVDDATLDHLIALNVRQAYKTAQAAARVMVRQKSGVIINMSSQMGHVGSPRRTVYCMCKHAIEGLTKAMAVELAPEGIRVVSVAPTFVLTPMTEGFFEDPVFKAMVMDSIPLRQLASPEDVAAAVVFLASDGARMITGESLRVDGGWTAR
jgi:NAD(P)-dependent dehydrogenase (short-subunit alcohol dehydrogenase family)